MSTVAAHAEPTPITSTPKNHAWGVSNGSCPMVRSKTHAARIEMASCNQVNRPFYAMRAAAATGGAFSGGP